MVLNIFKIKIIDALLNKLKFKILKKFGITSSRIFKSDCETISYKSNAWISPKSAAVYVKEVEEIFFENITWPLIAKNINKDSKNIIDVGAGTGRITTKIIDMFDKYQTSPFIKAIDISKNMLDYIKPRKNLEKIVSDAYNLPIANDLSDTTIAMEFLLHFPNWDDLLKEMIRVTIPGGNIIFNYVPEEHTNLTEKMNLLNPNPVAFTEYTPKISESRLISFCEKNNCNLKRIIPYMFFNKSELFRPLLRRSSYKEFMERYQNLYDLNEKKDLLKTYVDIENLIARNGDPRMCSLALAVIEVN